VDYFSKYILKKIDSSRGNHQTEASAEWNLCEAYKAAIVFHREQVKMDGMSLKFQHLSFSISIS
jgi:hypothetical protein